jgi:hypothetical protein
MRGKEKETNEKLIGFELGRAAPVQIRRAFRLYPPPYPSLILCIFSYLRKAASVRLLQPSPTHFRTRSNSEHSNVESCICNVCNTRHVQHTMSQLPPVSPVVPAPSHMVPGFTPSPMVASCLHSISPGRCLHSVPHGRCLHSISYGSCTRCVSYGGFRKYFL